MLKKGFRYVDKLLACFRSLASDERGSVVVEIGYGGIIFGLLIAGIFCFGSFFSKDIADDLKSAGDLLADLADLT